MEPTLRLVRCPCCLDPLYTLVTVSPGAVDGWTLTPDSPRLDHDDDGPFLRCIACQRRIAVVKDSTAPAGFAVARNQKCDRMLSADAPRRRSQGSHA